MPHNGQSAAAASERTVKIIESVESPTLSNANPLGTSDGIRKSVRMALIPHWRTRGRQQKSSEVSQTQYCKRFCTHELGNLKGAFNRLGLAHPTSNDVPLQGMITSVTERPFEDLNKAIRSKDAPGFLKAYGDLTSGCNACHQAMNHGVVVIRVPPNAFVPDQDFTPGAP
jgi:hypothetical protein